MLIPKRPQAIMGMFALTQFPKISVEMDWTFEKKKYYFFGMNFCEDFHVSAKYYSFYFFWFLSKHFNRVVRTILYVIELTFWGNLFCFEKN